MQGSGRPRPSLRSVRGSGIGDQGSGKRKTLLGKPGSGTRRLACPCSFVAVGMAHGVGRAGFRRLNTSLLQEDSTSHGCAASIDEQSGLSEQQGAGFRVQGRKKTLPPTPFPQAGRGAEEKKTTPFPAVRVVPPWFRGQWSGFRVQGRGRRCWASQAVGPGGWHAHAPLSQWAWHTESEEPGFADSTPACCRKTAPLTAVLPRLTSNRGYPGG